ncbi:MAG: DUF4286 family protein [Bacteroidota bacterium]
MLIYNVTINVDDSIHDDWLLWMRDIHIPEMLATKNFIAAKMCRVLVDESAGGKTYAIQYTAPNRESLNRYYNRDAQRMRTKATKRYANKFVVFRTELEVISEQQL